MKIFWMVILVSYLSIAAFGAGIMTGTSKVQSVAEKMGHGKYIGDKFVWNRVEDK